MAKKIISNLEHPKDVAASVLEFLSEADSGRIDGKFLWKNEIWKYMAYIATHPAGTIRIDMRKA